MVHLRVILALLVITLVALPGAATAELAYDIRGVDDPIKSNILQHIDTLQIGPQGRLADRHFDRVLANTISEAKIALRPYGYYAAEVRGRIHRESEDEVVIRLNISPGPPIIVEHLQLEMVGDGSRSRALRDWRKDWPLKEGAVLDQVAWEQQKQRAIELTDAIGYLGADFTTRTLEIDLERNRANIKLTLDTGPRFVMGDIDFGEHVLNPGILELVPRFEKGDPYTTHLMDRFRSDLWNTGYFTDIDVVQTEVPESEPPRVDLTVRTSTDFRNRYTGSLGFGTDTGLRLQANWSRHPMSASGDRIDLGIGWQELDDQFAVRATYRLPRAERNREFWTVDTVLKFESMDLEFKVEPEDDDYIKLANGNVEEQHLRLGRLKIRNLGGGETQLFETPFVQYINSEERFQPNEQSIVFGYDDETDKLLSRVDNAISIGVEYGLVNVLGKGFDIRGHRERAWVFHSNKAFGSEIEFTQLYASMRRSRKWGDRWKFIYRAEAGYTDANVNELTIDIGGAQLDISDTRLPNFYRFKAGGSQSVRGYGFESLSNNDIGSNHIVTASAEIEMKVLEKWSAAVFVDTGNAFNDWSEPQLKIGAGIGVRWYSIAGPISLDFAQALDFTDDPWRIHFTIGVPLL
jgi:translocation and assembly module TamA